MSGQSGLQTLSIKKTQTPDSILPGVVYDDAIFMHKAIAGDTSINLTSLTTPPEAIANGFVQPSAGVLSQYNIYQNRNCVSVESSLSGKLQNYLAFKVSGTSTIQLLSPAADGEIFTISLRGSPRTGISMLDAQPYTKTVVLASGQTTVNLGANFVPNQMPGEQVGSVMVFANGILLKRNTSNSSVVKDQDYYEVGSTVVLNYPVFTATPVTVVSVGALVERPLQGQQALIESVQGQIDSIVQVLSAVSGLPTTTFQAAPNQVDLLNFGQNFQTLLNAPIPIYKPAQSYSPVVTTLTGTMTNFSVAGTYEQIGSRIRVLGQISFSGSSGTWSNAMVSLPTGMLLDTALQAISSDVQVGFSTYIDAGLEGVFGTMAPFSNANMLFKGPQPRAGANPQSINLGVALTNTIPFVFNTGDSIRFDFDIPIAGLPAFTTLRQLAGL